MGMLEDLLRGRRRPRPPRPQTVIARHIGKGIAALIIAGGAALFGLKGKNADTVKDRGRVEQTQTVTVAKEDPHYQAAQAIAQKKEIPYIEIKDAKVVQLLRADNRGARHQRWLIQLSSGDAVTVVHNVDLADKVPVSVGDTVTVAGELTYNENKGKYHGDPLIHWTHADPLNKRMAGYVLLNGKKYGDLK